MSSPRTLRGGCQCGRNLYIIQPPPDASEAARLLFDPAASHRLSLASPLPAYLRVPLAWYHSTTQSFFPDETPSMIHRAYEHRAPAPATTRPTATPRSTTRRNFCGFCGTPLSFWSEVPRTEADYIRLTLGSLNTEDLEELDEWAEGGSEESEDNKDNASQESQESEESGESGKEDRAKTPASAIAPRGSLTGIPWFDSFVEGSRLSRHLLQQQLKQQKQQKLQKLQQQKEAYPSDVHVRRHDAGSAQSADGAVQVEWEVLEWSDGDKDDGGPGKHEPSPAKRARLGGDDTGPGRAKSAAAMDIEQ